MSLAPALQPSTSQAACIKPASHPLRRRIWKIAGAMALVLTVLIVFDVTARLRNPSHKLALGHDLLPSYAAGLVTRAGRPREMFDREAMTAVEMKIIHDADLDIDNRYGPWLNPPFYAWVFAPLSALPYRQAAGVFLVANLLLFAVSLALLTHLLKARPASQPAATASDPPDSLTLALLPLLVLLPLPFWQAMGHQQNTFISLLLLVGSVICWRSERSFLAGLITGLLFFKPQLAALFAVALMVAAGWRAFAGLAITGLFLLGVTLWTMPGCLDDFLHKLPPILHWLQNESPYNWGRQVTFQSFWRLLIQGHVRGENILVVKVLWPTCCAGVGAALALAAWRFRAAGRDGISRDRLIAAAIVSMPMVMPYYMDYDLLLLAIPPTLFAAEWIWFPRLITRADRCLLCVWGVFFVESHINPGLAGHSHLNLAVPILATLSILHISRALRPMRTNDQAEKVGVVALEP